MSSDLPPGLSIEDLQAVYRDEEGRLRAHTEQLAKSGANP